jgi:hypothetical protein
MKYSGSDDIGFVCCLIRFYNLLTSGDGFPCAIHCTERLLLSGLFCATASYVQIHSAGKITIATKENAYVARK